MTQPAKVIDHWIEAVNETGRGLTEWEKGFMESVTDQFEHKRWISDLQEQFLERIYADRTA
jgi:hypothetical protein